MNIQLDYKIVEAMEQYGGSFVKALAVCFRCADNNNFKKLQTTFAEYWEQYRKMTGYILCEPCNGEGYTQEHDLMDNHSPDGECISCPVQVPCVICDGEGIMEVDEVLGKNKKCTHGKGLTDYCLPCGRINSN